jgi:hypothetical protein
MGTSRGLASESTCKVVNLNTFCKLLIPSQEDYHTASKIIRDALRKSSVEMSSGWRTEGFKDPPGAHPEFEPGIADFSLGWHMQGHFVGMIFLCGSTES